jgi:hypothetical protein
VSGQPPDWYPPFPYGAAKASENAGSIAAPLLAGFSLTLVALVIDKTDKLRWPNVTLLLLVGAVILLLGAVQMAVWAREYAVTPDDIVQWWPDQDDRAQQLAEEQRGHYALYLGWNRRFRRAYHGGILLLLSAIAFAVMPPVPKPTAPPIPWERYLVFAVAWAGVLLELLWIGASTISERGVKTTQRTTGLGVRVRHLSSWAWRGVVRVCQKLVPPSISAAMPPPDLALAGPAATPLEVEHVLEGSAEGPTPSRRDDLLPAPVAAADATPHRADPVPRHTTEAVAEPTGIAAGSEDTAPPLRDDSDTRRVGEERDGPLPPAPPGLTQADVEAALLERILDLARIADLAEATESYRQLVGDAGGG